MAMLHWKQGLLCGKNVIWAGLSFTNHSSRFSKFGSNTTYNRLNPWFSQSGVVLNLDFGSSGLRHFFELLVKGTLGSKPLDCSGKREFHAYL